ncbi:substrate-binding domain-containing protein, partial [Actinomyces sp. MRS3W]|uniref:LacI family DNA-binding transcriptional regulator n=1 Tax=Actinomyces sp. MRS3W TaxID=2800796 RepID=UPI0028FD3E2E
PPLVLLDEPIAGPAAARVSVDNTRGGELVAEHLATTGRRRAAVIGAPAGMPTSVQRVEGFTRRARELGMEVPERAVARAVRRTGDAIGQATAILKDVSGIEAFFAGDDLLAITLIRALAAQGLQVPEDVAVCGFDDIPWAALVTPALTTVRQPAREMGRVGVDLALGAFADALDDADGSSRDVVLPVELIVRDSTAPAASDARQAGAAEPVS